MTPPDMPPQTPAYRTTLPVYIRIGLLSFGGPAGQIALMQEEIVERRGRVTGSAFQRALNVSMLLPGPAAQQLATSIGCTAFRAGWRRVWLSSCRGLP